MKIFDCTTYHNEDLILDIRLNVLNKFIDKFVICEALYTHTGKKKKLNFDIKKFSSFKNKIIYLVLKDEPDNLVSINKDNTIDQKYSIIRQNAIKRISMQRNKLIDGIDEASNDDLILYSDNDEIPDFSQINLNKVNYKLLIFEQKLFYYKFNLLLDRIYWYGTKGIKKKDLKTFQLLREVKPKKYPFYRIDTFFNNNKYIDVKIIKNGGWHFTRVISAEEIHDRELNTEHADEYISSGKNPDKIKDLIERRVIDHDHLADKKEFKFGKEFKLKLFSTELLPSYLRENVTKYKNFLD